jgi:cell division protein FtsZ
MTFELLDAQNQNAVIRVIGIGGGGGNAVNHMVASVIEGSDMVFITAGMGGGTGTGAAPVVAQIARELGILTVAVVTKPFPFEGVKRRKVADEGIAELAKSVDSLITIPNEKLLAVLGKDMSLLDAFSAANDVLRNATQGIAELITRPGLINVDFADVKTVMSEMGVAMMGTGAATGEERAREAAEAAINSPLLEDIDLSGARGILVNITAGGSLTIGEFTEVGDTVRDFADDDATVVVGTVIDTSMDKEMRVTVVATGLGARAMAAEHPRMRLVSNDPERPVAPDYRNMDQPAFIRNKRAAANAAASEQGSAAADLDYLDIPAFLRRQAD